MGDEFLNVIQRELCRSALEIADRIDNLNHPAEHVPGKPCAACVMRMVANLMMGIGFDPRNAIATAALVAMTEFEKGTGRRWTPEQLLQERGRLMEIEFKAIVMAYVSLTEVNDDREKTDKILYEILATFLWNLKVTSEEVGGALAARLAAVEAEQLAKEDNQRRRN